MSKKTSFHLKIVKRTNTKFKQIPDIKNKMNYFNIIHIHIIFCNITKLNEKNYRSLIKFSVRLFEIYGGVMVSTGIYDLLAACGGFLVTSLIIQEQP